MSLRWAKFLVSCVAVLLLVAGASATEASKISLASGWQVQSAAKVSEAGADISKVGYAHTNWYPTSVPATVVSTLLANKAYNVDPYVGKNMRSLPGMSYAIGHNFSNTLMPVESPFLDPWWFRTEFQVPQDYAGKRIALHFEGINYRANLWVNGTQIAANDKFQGAYRTFEYDVTDAVKAGQPNALALEILAPLPTDLAITFVDWNPLPPDKDMGIWKEVYLAASGPVRLRYPQVVTALDASAPDTAHLTVNAQVENRTDQPVSGELAGQFERVRFSKQVSLQPHESRLVSVTPSDAPELNVRRPRLWWPVQMGDPNLYDLHLEFRANGGVSDANDSKFGMRQVTSEMTPEGARLFKINGKNVLIRGAGWTPDMMLRTSPERQEQEIQYVKAMNLNTIRLEGKLEDEHFFDLADRYGILIMPGWCCCDLWEQWQAWEPKQVQTAGDSLHDQIMRLRSHPSVFVWLYGSDNPPTPDVEKMYLKILQDAQWPNPSISSAAAKPTTVTGPSGVKMSGPYDWVPPNYWLTDTKHGGAYGFNTETSPGPAVPPIQSLKKFIPADHLWPIDDVWNYHTGGGEFSDIHLFTDALNARYGKPNSAEDLARKSQWMTYEGERAMFEAYRRNKYTSTGIIQWMLNNAWPSLIWHLYDYYLLPGGGYFGTKKANEPLHIQYSYDDRSIAVVNDTPQTFGNLSASAEVYDTQMHKLFANTQKLNAGPDSTQRVFNIPDQQQVSGTYFVKLRLSDAHGKPVSDNFYWLSAKPDVPEFDKSEWYYTPVTQYADFTDLQKLPQAQIAVNSRALPPSNGRNTTEITLRNTGQALAFGVELRLVKSEDQDDVLPALWDDNYISLLPGESKTVRVSYAAQAGGASPRVVWAGANVAAGQ